MPPHPLEHTEIQTHTLFLALAFRSCIEDKSKSDCRVKGPPPALRVRLQLRGHRQLDREDQTAPLLSWCCVVTLRCYTHICTNKFSQKVPETLILRAIYSDSNTAVKYRT